MKQQRITRRKFLKTSSTAVVGGTLLSAVPVHVSSAQSSSRSANDTEPTLLSHDRSLNREISTQRLLTGWDYRRGGLGGPWEVWRKASDDANVWQTVTLPHCFNAYDAVEITHALFTRLIEASQLLNIDAEFRKRLKAALDRLPALKIGKHGQLQEWLEDYDEPEPGHRHVSHLFALHPGNEITPRGTLELAKAARVALERRLQAGSGQSPTFRSVPMSWGYALFVPQSKGA